MLDDARSSVERLRDHLLNDLPRLSPDRAPADSEFRRDQSQASREAGAHGTWTAAPVFDLQEMCVLGVLGTSNILLSVSRLTYLPVSIRSMQILTRTGLEIASRNHWLIDPTVSPRERVTRAVAEALHGTQEDVRAVARFDDERRSRGATQWADAAARWAQSLGLPLKQDKSGRNTLTDCRRPTSSAMIQNFVDSVGGQRGSALYGYLSAATHGQPFHLVQLGGESAKITPSTFADLKTQLLVIVQIMKVVHIRYAQYLGRESQARRRPYEATVKFLQRRADDDSAEIGYL